MMAFCNNYHIVPSCLFLFNPQSYGDLMKLEKSAGLCVSDQATPDSK